MCCWLALFEFVFDLFVSGYCLAVSFDVDLGCLLALTSLLSLVCFGLVLDFEFVFCLLSWLACYCFV